MAETKFHGDSCLCVEPASLACGRRGGRREPRSVPENWCLSSLQAQQAEASSDRLQSPPGRPGPQTTVTMFQGPGGRGLGLSQASNTAPWDQLSCACACVCTRVCAHVQARERKGPVGEQNRKREKGTSQVVATKGPMAHLDL